MKKIFLLNFIVFMFAFSEDDIDLSGWRYEKTLTVTTLDIDAKVVIPLEIITDLEIDATVVDDQKLEVPFTLVMNKNPNKNYQINYSEKVFDIDNDGRNDVTIESPTFANTKIVKENTLTIEGKNIRNEGTYRKRIYISVEIKDGGE